MDTVLRTLTNSKTVDEINSLDLPLPEYKTIFNAVMAACSGQTLEEFEEMPETISIIKQNIGTTYLTIGSL